jgi:hypothetical protein
MKLTCLTTIVRAALAVLADGLVWCRCRVLVAVGGSKAGSHDGGPCGVGRCDASRVDVALGDGDRGGGVGSVGGVGV